MGRLNKVIVVMLIKNRQMYDPKCMMSNEERHNLERMGFGFTLYFFSREVKELAKVST
jgi:hypothetical protein